MEEKKNIQKTPTRLLKQICNTIIACFFLALIMVTWYLRINHHDFIMTFIAKKNILPLNWFFQTYQDAFLLSLVFSKAALRQLSIGFTLKNIIGHYFFATTIAFLMQILLIKNTFQIQNIFIFMLNFLPATLFLGVCKKYFAENQKVIYLKQCLLFSIPYVALLLSFGSGEIAYIYNTYLRAYDPLFLLNAAVKNIPILNEVVDILYLIIVIALLWTCNVWAFVLSNCLFSLAYPHQFIKSKYLLPILLLPIFTVIKYYAYNFDLSKGFFDFMWMLFLISLMPLAFKIIFSKTTQLIKRSIKYVQNNH